MKKSVLKEMIKNVLKENNKDSVYIDNNTIVFNKDYMSRYGKEVDEIVDFINDNSDFKAAKVDEDYFVIKNPDSLLENIAETLKDFFE